MLIRPTDINCPIYRTLGHSGVKWSDIKKIKMGLLDVYSIKFEALLVVINLFVVDINAPSLNIKMNVHSFCAIITIYSRNFVK